MADDSDALFGLILFILFLALLGYAAGGMSSSPSSAGTSSGTTQTLPPLAGSSVSSCTGTLRQDEWDSSTAPTLNLKVYENSMDSGQKCATASTNSPEKVRVTLAYSADRTQMVSNTGDQTASVQVNGTGDYCVSAYAEIVGKGITISVPKVYEPCMMTVPATQPTKTWPTVRADDLEDEEGY